ncbi:MAG: beta-lactamase family protein [Pseudomonadales bacterium]|nr:beta-lactamase family protein [Pseudomonadales bacterium]
MTIKTIDSGLDFSEIHERMQWYVDQKIIPCCNTLVLRGCDVIDVKTYGPLSHEADAPSGGLLPENAIFRMYSNTKLVTSIAAMILCEEGRFKLDDSLETYLPEFANMQVLTPGATTADDTVASQSSITIRQVMSHSAGLSYAFIEPESVIDKIYTGAGINPMANSGNTLESLCADLSKLPLAFQPGTSWRYSLATDVLARLVEVWSGQRFDKFLKERIFSPLGMHDTDFFVPIEKHDRLTALYMPDNPLKVMASGYSLMDASAITETPKFLSGGGGLMSTLPDYLSFIQMLINKGTWNGTTFVKPETLELMRTNQLANGVSVKFPFWAMPDTVFGLGFALKQAPAEGEPASAAGEYHWGGMVGTHSWMSPNAGANKEGISGICMTQLMPGFWHPFSHDFKRMVYKITA